MGNSREWFIGSNWLALMSCEVESGVIDNYLLGSSPLCVDRLNSSSGQWKVLRVAQANNRRSARDELELVSPPHKSLHRWFLCTPRWLVVHKFQRILKIEPNCSFWLCVQKRRWFHRKDRNGVESVRGEWICLFNKWIELYMIEFFPFEQGCDTLDF